MDSMFDFIQLVASNVWTYGVTFLLVLSLLVFVHEWGHFIVARLCGVRVETFSIGFGKEIFGWTSKTGTRWKVSMIPLGGYVKMFGDADPTSASYSDHIQVEDGTFRSYTPEERSVAFFAKPVPHRAAIVFAGPAINFIFAIAVLSVLYASYGKPLTPPHVTGLEVGSAADRSGFEPHDIIKAINGKPITNFQEVRQASMLALDTPMDFVVERDGKEVSFVAHPEKKTESDRFGFSHEKGYLGLFGPANGVDVTAISEVNGVSTQENPDKARDLLLQNMDKKIVIHLDQPDKTVTSMWINPPSALNPHLSEPEGKLRNVLILGVRPGDDFKKYGPLEAVGVAIFETQKIVIETLKAIGQMITGTRSTTELGGIIRIGAMAGDMAERGYIALFTFTALLSINLGLINLFPIPMLDGGHLAFYAIESMRGKPLSEKSQEYAFRFGLVVLVTLMTFANLNDIIQLFLK